MKGTEGQPNTWKDYYKVNTKERVIQDDYYYKVSLQNKPQNSTNLLELCTKSSHANTPEFQTE